MVCSCRTCRLLNSRPFKFTCMEKKEEEERRKSNTRDKCVSLTKENQLSQPANNNNNNNNDCFIFTHSPPSPPGKKIESILFILENNSGSSCRCASMSLLDHQNEQLVLRSNKRLEMLTSVAIGRSFASTTCAVSIMLFPKMVRSMTKVRSSAEVRKKDGWCAIEI